MSLLLDYINCFFINLNVICLPIFAYDKKIIRSIIDIFCYFIAQLNHSKKIVGK